jgi:hypothetical protein
MAQNKKTLYEVLGVSRDAKGTDIVRAYNRIRADQQKETAAPDPRLLAMAKAAHDTLSDPDRRDEYDRSIAGEPFVAKNRNAMVVAASLAAVVAAGAGYYFASRSASPPPEKPLEPQELLAAVSPQVGRVQMALMSGEVRDLGTAVAIGENEMVTTCHGMTVGAQLSVKVGELETKAEMGKANQDLDICTLSVKNAGGSIKVREGFPGVNEKLEAVFLGPAGKPLLRQASVARFIDDPQGKVIEIRSTIPLPNGTPVFDHHGRLAAIITASNSSQTGLIVALPGSRVAQGQGLFGAFKPAPEAEPPSSRSVSPARSEPTEPGSRVTVDDLRMKALDKAVSESERAAK